MNAYDEVTIEALRKDPLSILRNEAGKCVRDWMAGGPMENPDIQPGANTANPPSPTDPTTPPPATKNTTDPKQAAIDLLDRIQTHFPDSAPTIANAKQVLAGKGVQTVNLLTAPEQLAWGITLGHEIFSWRKDHPDKPLKENPLWNHFSTNIDLENELDMMRVFALDGGVNPNCTMSWGEPGSWFYFSPVENHINIDPMYSLINGCENSRSIMVHEIGHSEETREPLPSVVEARKRLQELQKKSDDSGVSPQEFEEIAKLSTLVQLKSRWHNACEDNAVNHWAITRGNSGTFPHSLLQGTLKTDFNIAGWCGEEPAPPLPAHLLPGSITTSCKPPKTPAQQYGTVAALALQSTLGYFPHSKDGWKMMGVDLTPEAEDIREQIAGPGGLAYLTAVQALSRIEWADKNQRDKTQLELCRTRNRIMENLWDKYLDKDAQQQMQKSQQKAKQSLQNAMNGQDQPGQGQPGQGQPGSSTIRVNVPGGQKNMPVKIPQAGGPGQGKPDQAKGIAPADRGQPIKAAVEAHKRRNQTQTVQGDNETAKAAGQANDWIDNLGLGNLNDYKAERERLMPAIQTVKKIYERIMAAQAQQKPRIGPEHKLLPPDTNIAGRLNTNRLITLATNQHLGIASTRDERKLFRGDVYKPVPTPINQFLLIDGSGSMSGDPIKLALQTALIQFEATVNTPINTWIMIWGPNNPPIIAAPGMKTQEIQQRIQGILETNGLGTGTELAPALKLIAKTIAEQKLPPGQNTGCDHVFIASDGDIFDPDNTIKTLMALEQGLAGRLTFDVQKIGQCGEAIEQVVKHWQANGQHKLPGTYTTCQKPSEMLQGSLATIKQAGGMAAVPNQTRVNAAKKAVQIIAELEETAPTR